MTIEGYEFRIGAHGGMVMVEDSGVCVVLAAYDLSRWNYLQRACASLAEQSLAPDQVILVVDHNDQLYGRASAEFPDITVVRNERERGASGARNTGAASARTPIIAFLDDDVVADKNWLRLLIEPFAQREVVGCGGGIDAIWEGGRPRWFPAEFNWVVGASFLGMPTETAAVRNVWSENMAVRADAFRSVGGFREGFGKLGSRSRPEDTDLCLRITSANGGQWKYVPAALVSHHVPPARASLKFYINRCAHEGAGKVELARMVGKQQLGDEKQFVRDAALIGPLRRLRAAWSRRSLAPLAELAALLIGVVAAASGAAYARVSRTGG